MWVGLLREIPLKPGQIQAKALLKLVDFGKKIEKKMAKLVFLNRYFTTFLV